MKNDLRNHLDQIHTTKMGIERIRKNLCTDAEDILTWSRQEIARADNIVRKGKNWYASVDHFIFTVNAYSFTIITAHKDKNS